MYETENKPANVILRAYLVSMNCNGETWTEIEYGRNAAESIKSARRTRKNRGYDRHDGTVTYRTRLATADEIERLSSIEY